MELIGSLRKRIGLPVFQWTITEGLLRLEPGYKPQRMNSQPEELLGHVKSSTQPGIYVLLDFHPYLDSPVNVRLLKDIAIEYEEQRKTLVFISHDVTMPAELSVYSAEFQLSLPDKRALLGIVKEVTGKKRNRVFAYDQYLQVLSEGTGPLP